MGESEKICEKWVWNQKGEEVHVRIKLDPPAAGKKDVEVKFKSTHLVVKVRGESIIDGPMGGKVEVDDCTWCFTPERDELLFSCTFTPVTMSSASFAFCIGCASVCFSG